MNDITGTIFDASVKLHQSLGPGLLESVYEAILARDLARKGFTVERQKPLRFSEDDMNFEEGLRLDLIVQRCVIVELKSVEKLAPVHKKQLLTYLRLSHLPVGLLINFGAATLKEGLHRIVNNLNPSASPRLRVNQHPLPFSSPSTSTIFPPANRSRDLVWLLHPDQLIDQPSTDYSSC